ncbi:hypothetical protein BDR26DRAFT_929718 [Obelidium mucronatum]|nr:hypothetical protein BDR26DRAFT_929718 [Obelidium mucronatum]
MNNCQSSAVADELRLSVPNNLYNALSRHHPYQQQQQQHQFIQTMLPLSSHIHAATDSFSNLPPPPTRVSLVPLSTTLNLNPISNTSAASSELGLRQIMSSYNAFMLPQETNGSASVYNSYAGGLAMMQQSTQQQQQSGYSGVVETNQISSSDQMKLPVLSSTSSGSSSVSPSAAVPSLQERFFANTPPESSQSPPPPPPPPLNSSNTSILQAPAPTENKLVSLLDPTQALKKTNRFKAKDSDLKMLMAVFEKNPFPSSVLRKKLADRLKMDQKQVQFWFQNRRATLKVNGIHVLKPKAREGQGVNGKPNLVPLTSKSDYFYVDASSPPSDVALIE